LSHIVTSEHTGRGLYVTQLSYIIGAVSLLGVEYSYTISPSCIPSPESLPVTSQTGCKVQFRSVGFLDDERY